MLTTIALFEFKTRAKQLSTWIYFLVFFSVAMLWIAAAGGLLKGANISFGSGKVFVNSPFAIAQTVSFLGMFGLTVMAAIMGRAVQQDAEYRAHHFFFTSPISKWDYLSGRFLGAFGVLVMVFISIGLGAWVATMFPGMDAERLGANSVANYLWPYAIMLLPNAFLIGAIFFVAAALTKKMLPVYVGSVLLLIGYLISLQLSRDIDNKTLSALIDPFGVSALSRLTEYWPITERNDRAIPLEGILLWNRLLWAAIAVLIAGVGFWRFSFARFAITGTGEKPKASSSAETTSIAIAGVHSRVDVATTKVGIAMLPQLVWLNFRETVKNIYFGVLVFAGLLLLVFASTTIGNIFGTSTWPVTYQMTGLLGASFGLFMLIIIAFYAGELAWRERDNRIDQIIDATPMPTWLPVLSKLLTLMLVPLVLQLFLIHCSITIQASKGYFNFELHLYAKELLGHQLVGYWLVCALAFAIHSVVNQKYLGHFLVVLYYVVSEAAPALGFEHLIYQYGAMPTITYSDMNGFGHFLPRLFAFQAYWASAALLLVIVAYLGWTRGSVAGRRARWAVAQSRFTPRVIATAAAGTLLFAGIGGFIFYNTNVLNTYQSSVAGQQLRADYEKKYKPTAKAAQPRITAVKVNVDLYPSTQGVRMAGHYRLKNNNVLPVTDVWLAFAADALIYHRLEFSAPAILAENDKALNVRRYQLASPLPPGAEMTLNFDLEATTPGFTNTGSNTQVVYNGTFINGRNVLPSIGYQEAAELSRDQDRKEFGLAAKERMRDRDDPEGLKRNYLTADADWIAFETVVSTEEDQIAIAPGYLQKEWKDAGRRYFSYKMDVPILNFFAFQSARYAVKKDIWRNVPIEVYYHPGHEFNIDRMIASTKASLEYFSKAFSPYQHKQFRIIEFPRYATFAQAFPNTIPYSEGIGFIARVRDGDEKDLDYPYYVTAHEVAHQWWAHQLMGANVQGGTLLSETLAQYSAMMVMKQKYGDAKMQKFLAYEMDRYLGGRAFEQKKELPLARVENQQYIHYNKGSVVMYALQDYIGEENVNRALKALLAEGAYQGPPYPNATMFLKHIRAVTPAHLQYLIDDMFEKIIVFDNRTTKATYKELARGKFEVTLTITAKKREADKLGKETDVPLADWIDIGVLDEKGVPIYMEKRKIDKEVNEITLIVDKKPAKAGIDPLNKLIDRRPKDNAIAVEKIS